MTKSFKDKPVWFLRPDMPCVRNPNPRPFHDIVAADLLSPIFKPKTVLRNCFFTRICAANRKRPRHSPQPYNAINAANKYGTRVFWGAGYDEEWPIG